MDDQFEEVVEQPEELPPEPEEKSNRSWILTAVVGVLMLAVGLFLGYVGRGQFGPEAQAAKATEAAQAVLAQTQAAAGAEMMKYLTDQARHSKGEENAPVTVIEFSDYQ